MATARSSLPMEIMRLARLEKLCLNYIDAILDRTKGFRTDMPLQWLQNYCVACKNEDMKMYMGPSKKDVRNFITKREYLWKITQTQNAELVIKEPWEKRSALVHILRYLDRMICEERGNYTGVKLQDIANYLHAQIPSCKWLVNGGFDGLKSLLSEYPSLFLIDPYHDGRYATGTIRIINKAMITDDGTILISDMNGDQFDNPAYLRGLARVRYQKQDYGFLKDYRTLEEVYFSGDTLVNMKDKNMLWNIDPKQKFYFEALVSPTYLSGTSKSKWRVFRMELVHETPDDILDHDPMEADRMRCKDNVQINEIADPGIPVVGVGRGPTEPIPTNHMPSDLMNLQLADPAMVQTQPPTPGMAMSQRSTESRDMPFGNDGHTHCQAMQLQVENANPTIRLLDTVHVPLTKPLDMPGSLPSSESASAMDDTDWMNLRSPVATESTVPKATMRDAACQTDFDDTNTILLRILRNSPELLRWARALRP